MGFLNWAKARAGQRGKPGKPMVSPPTATAPTKQKGKKGQPPPPSWLADKWNKTKRVGGTAMTLGTGIAAGSMIPLAANSETETDIERMKSYQPNGVT
jgi:hypothetical protein